jgi:hypothetical protein
MHTDICLRTIMWIGRCLNSYARPLLRCLTSRWACTSTARTFVATRTRPQRLSTRSATRSSQLWPRSTVSILSSCHRVFTNSPNRHWRSLGQHASQCLRRSRQLARMGRQGSYRTDAQDRQRRFPAPFHRWSSPAAVQPHPYVDFFPHPAATVC